MTTERLQPTNPEQNNLHELIKLQEETAANVFKYIDRFIGDMYLSGRKIKIVSTPGNFILTLLNNDKSQIIFDASGFDTDFDATGVKSKYNLSYVEQDKTERRLVTYRFNQGKTFKSYINGEPEQKSEMTDEDFSKASVLLETINAFF